MTGAGSGHAGKHWPTGPCWGPAIDMITLSPLLLSTHYLVIHEMSTLNQGFHIGTML